MTRRNVVRYFVLYFTWMTLILMLVLKDVQKPAQPPYAVALICASQNLSNWFVHREGRVKVDHENRAVMQVQHCTGV